MVIFASTGDFRMDVKVLGRGNWPSTGAADVSRGVRRVIRSYTPAARAIRRVKVQIAIVVFDAACLGQRTGALEVRIVVVVVVAVRSTFLFRSS